MVTIEALGDHPLFTAWEAEQVSQCGYCEPGMVMALAALLRVSPRPGAAELAGVANICRCGIGPRVLRAIRRAGSASAPLSNGSSDSAQPASE